MKNTIKEQVTFKDTEVLEIYLDLLYRKLSSDIKLQNPLIVSIENCNTFLNYL